MNAPLPATPRLEMWFDFASPYSYLAIERIGELAARAEVRVDLRPFLLGPIFQAQGWNCLLYTSRRIRRSARWCRCGRASPSRWAWPPWR